MRLNEPRRSIVIVVLMMLGMSGGLAIQLKYKLASQELVNPSVSGKASSLASREFNNETDTASSNQNEMLPDSMHSEFPDTSPSKLEEVTLQLRADAAIREARYEQAVAILRELTDRGSQHKSARTLIKLAACLETMQQYEAALQRYQQALSLAQQEPVRTAALLGECRVWCQLGQAALAQKELYQSLLRFEVIPSDPLQMRLFHEAALAVVFDSLHVDQSSPISEEFIDIPWPTTAAEELLEDLVSTSRDPDLESDFTMDNGAQNVVRRLVKLEESADAILIAATSSAMKSDDLISAITHAAGLKLQVHDECVETLKRLTVGVAFTDLPLSVVLDAILVPLQLEWRQTGNQIEIESLIQGSPLQKQERAERLLRLALSHGPEHRLAPVSQLSLAALKHAQGEFDVARERYERTLEQFPDFPGTARVWLNIGKCLMAVRNEKALHAFQTASDLSPGGVWSAIAEANLGRSHLLNSAHDEAIVAFQRAALASKNHEIHAAVQLELASAYLMAEQFEQASQVIKESIHKHAAGKMQNEFVLLAGLIQSGMQPSTHLRQNDGVALLSAVSNLDKQQQFGEHWRYLQAQAYLELGFFDESEHLNREFQTEFAGFPLARRFQELVNTERSGLTASERLDTQNDPPAIAADIKTFEQERRSGSTADLLQMYKSRLEQPHLGIIEKRTVLRRMGLIYQQLGEHQMAMKCFTGRVEETFAVEEPKGIEDTLLK